MKKRVLFVLLLVVSLLCSAANAHEDHVSRRYYDDGILKGFGKNIVIVGTPEQIIKITRWLDQISFVPKGYDTLRSISNSAHELVIQHSDHALASAGRIRAAMTMSLINGNGDDVHIIFDAHIADSGSHMVYNHRRELIEYTATQNLFHELAHAMHMMNGTWRYFASEAQAIEEENIFRRQMAGMLGRPATQRYRVAGVLMNEPESDTSTSH